VRVRGQPPEYERAHRHDHRRREQRAAAIADELRHERSPEQPDLDVEQVAGQAAAQGGGAREADDASGGSRYYTYGGELAVVARPPTPAMLKARRLKKRA
jgi:hypothetical protein